MEKSRPRISKKPEKYPLLTVMKARPTRSVELTGPSHFRDVGGYGGQGGRLVRWRRLFRSDHLAALTPDDVALLSGLGLARVCDFRGDTERAPLVCALPGVVVHSLPIEPTVVQGMKEILESGQQLTVPDMVRLMQQTYRAFVQIGRASC